jgi:hypothetical protein
MSEKIKLSDDMNDWVSFFIFDALGQNHSIMMNKNYDPNQVEAKLIINGVECNVVETLKYMGQQFDEMVEKAAQEKIQEKVDIMFFSNLNEIERLSNQLKEEMEDKIRDMLR